MLPVSEDLFEYSGAGISSFVSTDGEQKIFVLEGEFFERKPTGFLLLKATLAKSDLVGWLSQFGGRQRRGPFYVLESVESFRDKQEEPILTPRSKVKKPKPGNFLLLAQSFSPAPQLIGLPQGERVERYSFLKQAKERETLKPDSQGFRTALLDSIYFVEEGYPLRT